MIDLSKVSVIMPVYNEEKYIEKSLMRIIEQDWQGFIDIIIVDGKSEDETVNIITKLKNNLPDNVQIKVFTNPKRYIPVSLNIACENASSDIIIRIDGHTLAPRNYISQCIKGLQEINFQGIVGGRCVIQQGDRTDKAEAIALAVSNKFGVGNASYRIEKEGLPQYMEVDTVPFGSFTKELWNKLNGYDETLLYDEDFDFNFRTKKLGLKVIMNNEILLDYFARKNFAHLSRQYFRYGYWANAFCIKHRTIPNIRRFVPLSFLICLLLSLVFSTKLFSSIAALYIISISCVSFYETKRKNKSFTTGIYMATAIIMLHFSYGSGSLISILQLYRFFLRKY